MERTYASQALLKLSGREDLASLFLTAGKLVRSAVGEHGASWHIDVLVNYVSGGSASGGTEVQEFVDAWEREGREPLNWVAITSFPDDGMLKGLSVPRVQVTYHAAAPGTLAYLKLEAASHNEAEARGRCALLEEKMKSWLNATRVPATKAPPKGLEKFWNEHGKAAVVTLVVAIVAAIVIAILNAQLGLR